MNILIYSYTGIQVYSTMNNTIVKLPLPILFFKSNFNDERRNTISLLSQILLKSEYFYNMSYENQIDIIKKIEQKIYAQTMEKGISQNIRISWQSENFTNLYNVLSYKITSNLDSDSIIGSSYLLDKLMDGQIEPEKIAEMDSLELCPDKHIDIIEKINNRKETEIEYRFSKFVACKICKKYTCVERFVQKRSLDEAKTAVYDCVNCDKAKLRG